MLRWSCAEIMIVSVILCVQTSLAIMDTGGGKRNSTNSNGVSLRGLAPALQKLLAADTHVGKKGKMKNTGAQRRLSSSWTSYGAPFIPELSPSLRGKVFLDETLIADENIILSSAILPSPAPLLNPMQHGHIDTFIQPNKQWFPYSFDHIDFIGQRIPLSEVIPPVNLPPILPSHDTYFNPDHNKPMASNAVAQMKPPPDHNAFVIDDWTRTPIASQLNPKWVGKMAVDDSLMNDFMRKLQKGEVDLTKLKSLEIKMPELPEHPMARTPPITTQDLADLQGAGSLAQILQTKPVGRDQFRRRRTPPKYSVLVPNDFMPKTSQYPDMAMSVVTPRYITIEHNGKETGKASSFHHRQSNHHRQSSQLKLTPRAVDLVRSAQGHLDQERDRFSASRTRSKRIYTGSSFSHLPQSPYTHYGGYDFSNPRTTTMFISTKHSPSPTPVFVPTSITYHLRQTKRKPQIFSNNLSIYSGGPRKDVNFNVSPPRPPPPTRKPLTFDSGLAVPTAASSAPPSQTLKPAPPEHLVQGSAPKHSQIAGSVAIDNNGKSVRPRVRPRRQADIVDTHGGR